MKYLLVGEETERLRFRMLLPNDFDTWIDLFKKDGVGNFLGMTDISTPEEQCQKWFDIIMNRYKNDLGGMNVLMDKNTGKLLGQCGLLVQDVDGIKELEIGYAILPKFWNQGYATEAAIKCKEYAFQHNFSDSLISIIHIDNIRSEKVARKNGMALDKQTVFKEMPVKIFRVNRL
ncbi:MAG: GNAT family N-acetyltransferase [Calditrichaceae bacterium]|nr:GNAT family N-acetyltransferase [Calditrichaceae bacterium]